MMKFAIVLAFLFGAVVIPAFGDDVLPAAPKVAIAGTAKQASWNRSASFPDANPPFNFNGDTGENIHWKTRLPNWSNSSPIVYAGHVYCTSEPVDGSYSPVLHCIDADTGVELWQRELDAVACFPEAQQKEVRQFAKETYAWLRENEHCWSEATAIYWANKARFVNFNTPPDDLAVRWAELRAQCEKLGCEFKAPQSGAGGYSSPFRATSPQRNAALKRITDLGLMWDTAWRGFGTWVGVAYPTPAADESGVYTVTMHNLYSCYDHAGNLRWQVRFPPATLKALTPEQQALFTRRWPGGWPGSGGFSTSPRLVDGILVSNAGVMLRGIDTLTGKVLWERPARGLIDQSMAVPAIVRVDGEAVMIAVGDVNRVGTGDEIVRIKDGASVGFLPGFCSGKERGTGPVVDGDLVVTWGENNLLVAYRLAWAADRTKIETTEVWRRPRDNVSQGIMWRGCWCDGLAYTGNSVLDVQTGKLSKTLKGIATPGIKFNQGYFGGGGCLIGPAFCTWDFYDGVFAFRYRTDGKMLGIGRLPVQPKDGASSAQKLGEEKNNTWHWLSAATPWAEGDRLYIRSYDFLWCINTPVYGTSKDDHAVVQKIRAMTLATDLLPYLSDPSAQYRYEAITKLAIIDVNAMETKLKDLATTDPDNDVRALAIKTLDAHSVDGKGGLAVLKAQLLANPKDERLQATVQSLGFGYVAFAPVVTEFQTDDTKPELRAMLMLALEDILSHNNKVCTAEIRDVLVKRVGLAGGRWLGEMIPAVRKTIIRCLTLWPYDPEIVALMRTTALLGGKDEDTDNSWSAFGYLQRNLPQKDILSVMREITASRDNRVAQAAKQAVAEIEARNVKTAEK